MNILFAVALNEPAAVVQAVEEIAERLGGTLYVLHVMQPAQPTTPDLLPSTLSGIPAYMPYDPDLQPDLAELEMEAFRAFVAERFQRPAHAALREGVPERVVLADADALDAGLIVLGRRHHSRLERWLLGSTAANIVHRTTRPTLLIPYELGDSQSAKA